MTDEPTVEISMPLPMPLGPLGPSGGMLKATVPFSQAKERLSELRNLAHSFQEENLAMEALAGADRPAANISPLSKYEMSQNPYVSTIKPHVPALSPLTPTHASAAQFTQSEGTAVFDQRLARDEEIARRLSRDE